MRKFIHNEDDDTPIRDFPPIRKNTARRLYPTVSHEIYMFLQYHLGEGGNLSEYITRRIKADPHYKIWKETHSYDE